MNLEALAKMRASCPSRASLMDFLNRTDSSITIVKQDTSKADEMSPVITETKLAKTPLGDITNIQTSRDNNEKRDVVKEDPVIFNDEITEPEPIKAPTEERADGCLSPIDDEEMSRIEEPTPSPYRYESTETLFSGHPTKEAANNEISSVTNERVELNPEAPVFTQQQTPEQKSTGSPVFEVSSRDLSSFDDEESEAISDESPSHQEAAEPQLICYPTHEAADSETSPACEKQTSPVTEEYPTRHYEAIEPQSVIASVSEHETHEISPTSDKGHTLTHHEAVECQSVEAPYHEAVDYQHQSAYYEYLDTILEETEPEHDGATETRFIQGDTTRSDASSPFESSTASSSKSEANDSEVIPSQISDSLEIGTTIVDPEVHGSVTSGRSSEGGKKRTIRFDRNGDLYLKVGVNHFRNMLVDSRALGRASAKLHSVISQTAKDSTGGSWTVEFPEDDPKSFAILLNLIHARFEKVPAQVTLEQLYGVCNLASKYDMTSVLRPVAERWYLSARTLERTSIFKMAFIAWELGFAIDFGEIVGYITHNCFLDDDSQLVFGPSKERLAENEILQKLPILTCIEEHRQLALETF